MVCPSVILPHLTTQEFWSLPNFLIPQAQEPQQFFADANIWFSEDSFSCHYSHRHLINRFTSTRIAQIQQLKELHMHHWVSANMNKPCPIKLAIWWKSLGEYGEVSLKTSPKTKKQLVDNNNRARCRSTTLNSTRGQIVSELEKSHGNKKHITV